MITRRKSALLLVFALITSIVVSACGSKPAPAPADTASGGSGSQTQDKPKIQGSMIHAVSGDPVTFNPILSGDTTSGWIIARVFSGLVRIDEKLEPIPDLATEWSTSADGLEWTFKLRQDVKFHDGKPLTAEDVAYTYNAIKTPGYTGPRGSTFKSLSKVEVVDPYTVKFILSEPFTPLLTSLTYGILPKHLYADKPVAEMKDNPANRKPIGTGPWKFGEWVTGQYIALDRNDDYYGEGPYIPHLRLKFVQDSNVMVTQLEAGELDILGLPAKDKKRIVEGFSDKLNFHNYQALNFTFMGFNYEHPLLADKAVRHAIAYAIDREQIISDILEGEAVIMDAPMPPASWAYEPNVPKLRYNTQKAMETLEKAGYKKGPDGIYAKDGKRLSFTLSVQSGSPTIESIALFAQKNLKDVGIELKPDFIEWSVFLEKHIFPSNFEMLIVGYSMGVDPDQYSMFHSSQGEKVNGRIRGFNMGNFKNPTIDKLLEDGRKESDKQKRKAIYSEYQKLMADEIPWLILYNLKATTAIKKNIQGVIDSPQGPTMQHMWYSTTP